MTTTGNKAKKFLEKLEDIESMDELRKAVAPKKKDDVLQRQCIPSPLNWSSAAKEKRLEFIERETGNSYDHLSGKKTLEDAEELKGNIENYLGMTQVPTGIIGPLLVNGTSARGDFFIPLATTEGALVASFNRGAKATRLSGGITSVCLTESVQRAPLFKFLNISEVGGFTQWVLTQMEKFREITGSKSRFAKLIDMRLNIEGNQIILIFDYTTGDASGQNMVTLCTDAICHFIEEHSPVKPQYWFVESNYSGDKKATAVAFTNVRGKKVVSEIVLPANVVQDILKTTPQKMMNFYSSSSVAAALSGSIGIQGHYANGLAALFLACGQDVACVSEATVGITRMEITEAGDLYACCTLPGLIVGTVGGGTSLPTQSECLKMMDCYGQGKARKFAEICGATVLAGELSIVAALSCGDFAKAHKLFGRNRNKSL